MPLMLICKCDRQTPLPETSGTYKCSQCGNRIELTYFRGPAAWDAWQQRERSRIFARAEAAEPARVELRG